MAQAETAQIEDKDDKVEILESKDDNQSPVDGQNTDQNIDDKDDGANQDDDEVEIVLDGGDGSHPEDDGQHGFRKRINKLNAKVAEANTGQQQSTADLEVERERNRLLQLALDQKNQPVDGPPDPNDFDNGVSDAEYIKAFRNHIAKGVTADMLKMQQTTQTQTKASGELNVRQNAHYKKADMLKVKDYEGTEDITISILGLSVVNEIISEFDKTPEILYYLGKNKKVAEEINELILSGKATKAAAKVGAIEARLKERLKSKVKPAPDPDGELQGGAMAKTENDKKLDKMREEARSGDPKSFVALMDFKKKMRA